MTMKVDMEEGLSNGSSSKRTHGSSINGYGGGYPSSSTCSVEGSQDSVAVDLEKSSPPDRKSKLSASQSEREGSISLSSSSEPHHYEINDDDDDQSTYSNSNSNSGLSSVGSGDRQSSCGDHREEVRMMMNSEARGGGGGYDPNRIPVSIFGNRPANPGEWSVASNESLFSLHMTNGSLSRENFLMLYKSGELGRLDQPQPQPTSSNYNTADHFHPSLPPVTELADNKSAYSNNYNNNIDKDTTSDLSSSSSSSSYNHDVLETDTARSDGRRMNLQTTSPSVDSVNSNKSFAFAVLEGDGESTNRSLNMKRGRIIAKAESEKMKKQLATTHSDHCPQNHHHHEDPQTPSEKEQQQQQPKSRSLKPGGSSSWLSCFQCFSFSQQRLGK